MLHVSCFYYTFDALIQYNNNTNTIQIKAIKTMTKKELIKLKKSLPKGYRDVLAEKFNCSMSTVDMVLVGTRKNIELIKVAIELAKDHKIEMENLSKEIKGL